MENQEIINREIRRLSVLIALGKHDYSDAVRNNMPEKLRLQIADEICELERQKKCLEIGNYKALPYSIKMLCNGQK